MTLLDLVALPSISNVVSLIATSPLIIHMHLSSHLLFKQPSLMHITTSLNIYSASFPNINFLLANKPHSGLFTLSLVRRPALPPPKPPSPAHYQIFRPTSHKSPLKHDIMTSLFMSSPDFILTGLVSLLILFHSFSPPASYHPP
jgi:hypothetical protein